jgi:surfactin synthase thioesterase subunit
MREPVSLLCFPCAGASASMYLRWRRTLPRWIDLVPVELPGRGVRLSEPGVEDFDTLVSHLSNEHAAALSGAYALFGHSMGAKLAYGIAHHQQAMGARLPLALVASGSPSPSRPDAAKLPAKADIAGLIAHLRRQGGTPEEVFESGELMRITLDVLGTDFRVCDSFRRRDAAPLALPLHVLAGRQDDIAPARIEAWLPEASGPTSIDWFDGGHFFIRQQEAQVLAVLTERLRQSVAGGVDVHRALA